jgi:hypothetical protein
MACLGAHIDVVSLIDVGFQNPIYILNSDYCIKDIFVSKFLSSVLLAQSRSKSTKDGGACSDLLLNSVKTQVSGTPEVQFLEAPLGGAAFTISYFVSSWICHH